MARKGAESGRKDMGEESIAVAIDKDKGSQYALKWAVDQFLTRGQYVTLLHVKQAALPRSMPGGIPNGNEELPRTHTKNNSEAREFFLPFRCFCTRKDIKCHEVLLEDVDIPKALVDYVNTHVIDNLILGTPSKGGLLARKFKTIDVPTAVSKLAPDFCAVYAISKGKVSSMKAATAPAPPKPPPQQYSIPSSASSDIPRPIPSPRGSERSYSPRIFSEDTNSTRSRIFSEDTNSIRSPFQRGRGKSYEPYTPEMDISFVSSQRPSMFSSFHDSSETGMMASQRTSGLEYDSRSFASSYSAGSSIDMGSQYSYSSSTEDGRQTSRHSQMEDVELEMRRLRLELKQTMDMYNSACKEALTAKQKSKEFQRWKFEEQQRFEEARLAEEAALALIEKEKIKTKAAIEAAQAAQRLAELEAQKRKKAEMKMLMDSEEEKGKSDSWMPSNLRYRRYTIEEIEGVTDDFSDHLKIGEGGYGPVYKAILDHTEVAIKVLRPDAAQGKSQFQQEVEVLSSIRHPNMVLLLGACPEYGCLVYEYMANGSLDDRLFRRGNSSPLPWQVRFRIAAEIATGLLFLHQTKPEPLVHRDLKPGNILLDRNFVSKISDVGLARLVPPSLANSVTQYRLTSTAGTFCYIDPEYQQTGMLGTKSDIYSLGVMLLQIITAKSPMGLAHYVQNSIDDGNFAEALDPAVPDWPMDEALKFANLALQCTELRRKDRPDLGKVILPLLNRLKAFAEDRMPYPIYGGAFMHSHVSSLQEMMMSDVPTPSDTSTISSTSSRGRR